MIRTKGVVTGVLNNRQGVSGIVTTGSTYISPIETDPTVPEHVKAITEEDISKWNSNNGGGGGGGTTNYNDLTNKPVINNVELSGELSLEQLGIQPAGDYAKADDIPTNISDLTNDSGYLTEIPEEYATETFVKNEIANAQLGGKEVDLSGYATKDDLKTKVDKVDGKSLIDDSEIERLANISNYDDTEIRDLINAKANPSDIPTKVSELTNDANYLTEIPEEYITETELNDKGYLTEIPEEYVTETELNNKGYLTNHQDISHLASKDYVVEAIGNVKTTDFQTADELPTENISTNTIYLISKEATENNIYEEYIYVNNSWEKIGETDVDLSQYYTKEEINNKGYLTSYDETDPVFKASPSANITNDDIANWNNKSEFDGNYSSLNGTPDLFSGSYNDLTDKPSIPTVPTDVSAFNNDAGYLTSYTETDPTVPSHVKGITEAEISKWNSMRKIYTSTSSPSASDGANGDIWIIYEG